MINIMLAQLYITAVIFYSEVCMCIAVCGAAHDYQTPPPLAGCEGGRGSGEGSGGRLEGSPPGGNWHSLPAVTGTLSLSSQQLEQTESREAGGSVFINFTVIIIYSYLSSSSSSS